MYMELMYSTLAAYMYQGWLGATTSINEQPVHRLTIHVHLMLVTICKNAIVVISYCF